MAFGGTGGSEMGLVVIIVGAFGVFAGWHWKLLHRAVSDADRYKAAAKAAKKVEQEHWGRAVMFGVGALLILLVVAKIH
jgi:hypothetical protein